ncbi:MAG: hypothetical protein Kow0088_01760 [Anaerolineales bacterium]
MPTVTRWLVKTSFVYLSFALLLGILQTIPRWTSAVFFPSYVHLLAFGWLTQLIFGISIWMLPKFSNENPRGYDWINWLTYFCLNFGLVLRFVFEPLQSVAWANWRAGGLILSAILQWLSCIVFVGQAWFRVKGR